MPLSVKIDNFRSIKTANLNIEGISFLYAKNRSGKSNILKAIKTVLDNIPLEINKQHGQNSFKVELSDGKYKLVYLRDQSDTVIKFNNEEPRVKIGRDPLYKVESRVSLKRIDFSNSTYYPNFSFQGEIPLFNSISVVDLFSSIFSSVTKLTDRLGLLRSELLNLSKSRTATEGQLDFIRGKITDSKDKISKVNLDYPNLKQEYSKYKDHVGIINDIKDIKKLLDSKAKFIKDKDKLRAAELYNSAKDYFYVVTYVQSIRSTLDLINLKKSELYLVGVS